MRASSSSMLSSIIAWSIKDVIRRTAPSIAECAHSSSPAVIASSQITAMSSPSLSSSSRSPAARESRRRFSTSASCRHTFKRPITTVEKQIKAEEDAEGSDRAVPVRELPPGLESVLPPSLATKISFRPSKREDCATILKYLRAHAQWEGCQDEVEITESDLIRDGFEGNPCFRCDLAEAYGKDDVPYIIGYALYSVTYCAWKGRTLMWENLFIHPHYRDYGIGSIFFHKVSKTQYEEGCRRISGYVDANETELVRWYESLGFDNLTRRFDFHIYSGLTTTDANRRVAAFLRDGDRSWSKAMAHGIRIE